MKTTKVTCDNCGSDLTTTGNSGNTRVVLTCEQVPNPSGISTAMVPIVWPEHPLHFCSDHCFWVWAASKVTT